MRQAKPSKFSMETIERLLHKKFTKKVDKKVQTDGDKGFENLKKIM